jgi:long-chain acyl-CoA synthetase
MSHGTTTQAHGSFPGDADARPWLRFYGSKIPTTLSYPRITVYQALAATAARQPDAIAWDFFGTTATYNTFLSAIDTCAGALSGLGLKRNDKILILMPNSPQAIVAFYAANKLGAVAAFVHPLSTAAEIERYLNATAARIAITLDTFYEMLAAAKPTLPLETIILTRITDRLPRWKSAALYLKNRRLPTPVPDDARIKWWRSIMKSGVPVDVVETNCEAPAVVMFSGGTTGLPKGIVLSNYNLVSEAIAASSWLNLDNNHSVLAAMPIFHGFGLSLSINAALMLGGTTILLPAPRPDLVAELVRKKRPNVLLAVPSFFRSLMRNKQLQKADLSHILAAFCGGDTLPPATKKAFDSFLAEHGSQAKLLEGYGLTEAVSAVMAMPPNAQKENSIGIPFPDVRVRICKIGTDVAALPGEEGEICISGPPVMVGYLNDRQATETSLHRATDGAVWLHTGDLGTMDGDGFFYFKERLKRLIKCSGFNIFPSEVEDVLHSHPLVRQACVVGIPDAALGHRIKAYVTLQDGAQVTAQALIKYCRSKLVKWSCPRQIEFRTELPLTKLGKIDYQALQGEHPET